MDNSIQDMLQREEIPDIPDVALREAIINAVCHMDYFDKSANVLIEVFDDRVEISNPGGLPSGLKPSEFGSKSVSLNPFIASLLSRINYIEKVGTGINRIKQAVAENEKSSVEFSFDSGFSVVFRKLKPISESRLGENELAIVKEISNNPKITIAELSQKIEISITAIENNITKLKEKGILQRIGPDKGGYWEIGQGFNILNGELNS